MEYNCSVNVFSLSLYNKILNVCETLRKQNYNRFPLEQTLSDILSELYHSLSAVTHAKLY
jgi:hypothetical protein